MHTPVGPPSLASRYLSCLALLMNRNFSSVTSLSLIRVQRDLIPSLGLDCVRDLTPSFSIRLVSVEIEGDSIIRSTNQEANRNPPRGVLRHPTLVYLATRPINLRGNNSDGFLDYSPILPPFITSRIINELDSQVTTNNRSRYRSATSPAPTLSYIT